MELAENVRYFVNRCLPVNFWCLSCFSKIPGYILIAVNYFRIYLHYTYFNLFRNFYFQLNNLFAYVLLIPTIALGTITLGIMNQIIRAFSEVTSSFQYLVRSWSTIIDLISVFKRLQAFEAAFDGKSLPKLDLEYIKTDGRVDK